MKIFRTIVATALLLGTACEAPPIEDGSSPFAGLADVAQSRQAGSSFQSVVSRVEPIAERVCRSRNRNVNCDFRIVLDDRRGAPSNAFQTEDESGRPIIAFTLALINDAENEDELAFILAHEAAHHILGHLRQQRQNASVGAEALGGLATRLGGTNPDVLEAAASLGALVGARTFSRTFELQADALGTRIAAQAGYDPVRGAAFFFRIPDPGDRFLGSHPPNAERIETVNRIAQELGL